MEAVLERRNDREDRRWRRIWRFALLGSVLLHLLFVLVFRSQSALPDVPQAAAGPKNNDRNAAEGGGSMHAVAIQIPEPPASPAPIPRPAVPVPIPDAPKVVQPQPPQPQAAPQAGNDAATAGAGQGTGNKTGPGIAGGTGQGDGGDAASGLYRMAPPTPRGLILPPSDRPGSVRGKEVVVYVFVSPKGRVVSDSTRLAPSTGDSKFDGRLRKQAAEWVFNPARQGGQPVGAWFKYTIIL